jgi:hypothetical protein
LSKSILERVKGVLIRGEVVGEVEMGCRGEVGGRESERVDLVVEMGEVIL